MASNELDSKALDAALQSLDRIVGRLVMKNDPASVEAFAALCTIQKHWAKFAALPAPAVPVATEPVADALPVYAPDPFKKHVVKTISEAMGEMGMVRDSSQGSMFEQFAAYAVQLRKLIGDAPNGSHAEEWLPRHATWHGERANWIGEVERLRAHIKQLGSVVPEDGAPSRAVVQSALMEAIEQGVIAAEIQHKSDIPSEYITIDYAGIVGKIMRSLYAALPAPRPREEGTNG